MLVIIGTPWSAVIKPFLNIFDYNFYTLITDIVISFKTHWTTNFSYQYLTLKGYAIVYEKNYSHATTYSEIIDIRNTCAETTTLCAGGNCNQTGNSFKNVVACGNCLVITRNTTKNLPVQNGSVYWYLTPNLSFGFATSNQIYQNLSDTLNQYDEDRLSWNLNGDGGWRMGSIYGSNTNCRKYLFKKESTSTSTTTTTATSTPTSTFTTSSFSTPTITDHSVSQTQTSPTSAITTIEFESSLNLMTSSQLIQLLSSSDYDLTGCMVNCSNHGLCKLNSTSLQYGCVCDQFFYGSSCQSDIRPCSRGGLCINNGTCVDIINLTDQKYDFECQCENMFEGRHCENVKDVCRNETCSNNGYCVSLSQEPTCKCFVNFEGEKCEQVSWKLKSIRNAIRITSIVAILILILFYLGFVLMDLHKMILNKRKNLSKVKPRVYKVQYKN